MADLTLNLLGLVLAAIFLGLMLFLFHWMFAVPPPAPMQVINVKTTVSNLNRIVVPLVETVASERAVELACRLASDQKSEIILAFVIVVPLSLSLDTPMPGLEEAADRALDTGEFIVKQHKLKCEKRAMHNRTATEGILQLVREVDADVVVMGAGIPQRRNFAELSQTVLDVLRRAPCEVIVAKAPLPA
jgi:nucleotide-binding universal stress UspA family protein